MGDRNNLAAVLKQQGQDAEVEGSLKRLLPLLQTRLGRDSPQASGCMRKLLVSLAGQGRIEEAREMCGEGMVLGRDMEEKEKDEGMEGMLEAGEVEYRWLRGTLALDGFGRSRVPIKRQLLSGSAVEISDLCRF